MKIDRTPATIAAAEELLAYLRNDPETCERRQDPVLSVSEDGGLMFYNAACGTDESEAVLVERVEQDCFGSGWDNESVSAEDVIAWIEENCQPIEAE